MMSVLVPCKVRLPVTTRRSLVFAVPVGSSDKSKSFSVRPASVRLLAMVNVPGELVPCSGGTYARSGKMSSPSLGWEMASGGRVRVWWPSAKTLRKHDGAGVGLTAHSGVGLMLDEEA